MCRFYGKGLERYYRLCYRKRGRRGEHVWWAEGRADLRTESKGASHCLPLRLIPRAQQKALFPRTRPAGENQQEASMPTTEETVKDTADKTQDYLSSNKKPGTAKNIFGDPKPMAQAMQANGAHSNGASIEGAPLEGRPLECDANEVQTNPWQPRTIFDEDEMQDMVASVKEKGLVSPVLLRILPDGTKQLIAGGRRLEACKRAGVPLKYFVRQVTDLESAEIALIENLQRSDLNPVDEARGYRILADEFHMTQEDIARRLHRSQPVVANTLSLLNLPEDVQKLIGANGLSSSHGATLARLDNEVDVRFFANRALEGAWSVKALEAEIAAHREEEAEKQQPSLPVEDEAPPQLETVAPVRSAGAEADMRRLLAVLTTEPRGSVGAISAAGLCTWDAEKAFKDLEAAGKVEEVSLDNGMKGWRLVPDASQAGDHDTPSPVEKRLEGKAKTGATDSDDTTEETAVCSKCGKTEAQVQAAGAHMTKFDLCSDCDPEAQAAAAAKSSASEPAKATKNADAFKLDDFVQWNDGNGHSKTGQIAEVGKALYFVQPTGTSGAKLRKSFKKKDCILQAWDGKSAPEKKTDSQPVKTAAEIAKGKAAEPAKTEPPKAAGQLTPAGQTWILAAEADVFACQDAGLSIADVFATVKRLAEIGALFGLTMRDMVTTIEGYFGVTCEENAEENNNETSEDSSPVDAAGDGTGPATHEEPAGNPEAPAPADAASEADSTEAPASVDAEAPADD